MDDTKRRASERRWLIGTCLGLIGFFGCLGYFAYSSRQAQIQTEAQDDARKRQLQARLVAQIKAEVADSAYDGHIDLHPNSVSPVMNMREELQTAQSFVEYELTPTDIKGVIRHLYNDDKEKQALVRYLERLSGKRRRDPE